MTKILLLTHQLPYPPKSGGTVKSWNYVSFLAKKYALSVGCLLKDDDEKHLEDFQRNIQLEALYTKALKVKRSPINLAKSYLFSSSLNVFRNYSSEFKRQIAEVAAAFPVLIVDHYEMFQYVPKSFSGKVIMHTHNAEFMLWQRMSELTNNPVKKLILKLEANRVKKYEKATFSRSDLIYSTPSDIELYENHGFDTAKHKVTYHLGNDSLLKLPQLEFERTEKAITFIGTLSWEPNIDGLVWFLTHCWKTIKKQEPDCKLYILGSKPDNRITDAANGDSQIIFTGFVKNLEDYLRITRVYIAPLRFGSGMKVKVLEGLYRGTPTVSTSVGAEGLAVESGKEIMIADTAELFANHCLELLKNNDLWNGLRDNSRKVAAEKYCWSPLFKMMDEELQKQLH